MKWTDEVAIPASDPVIVSLVRWCEERDALIDRKNLVGARLKAEQTVIEVAADLEHIGVVALDFKTFRDGRGVLQRPTTTRTLRLQRRTPNHRQRAPRPIPFHAALRLRRP